MGATEAEAALKEGDLGKAREHLMDAVRKDPSSARHRVFLFQLSCIIGDWDRARTQLDVAAGMDKMADLMAALCRPAIACEALRADVFRGKRTPVVFGEPAPWVALLVQSLSAGAAGHHQAAAELRAQALESAPAIPGTLNDQPFEWLADADSRMGPMLEVILDGRYVWVPLTTVRTLSIEPPEDLRDLVWLPARFTWTNGGSSVALLPGRYPGSEFSDDDAVKLGRKTLWQEVEGDAWHGLGQRIFSTESLEMGLYDVRTLTFDEVAEEPAEGQDG